MRNFKAVWINAKLVKEYEFNSLTTMIKKFKENSELFYGKWIPRDAKLDGL